METRACIQKCINDIDKYGARKMIKVNQIDVVINEEVQGFLCDYELADCEIDLQKDVYNGSITYTTTLGELLNGERSPFVARRLYCNTSLQDTLNAEDIINNDLLKIIENGEEKEYSYYKKGDANKYKEYVKNMCSPNGIIIGINECCKQDIMLFGEKNYCSAKFIIENGTQKLVDWVIQPCLADYDEDRNDNSFYVDMTLKEAYDILLDQDNGKYKLYEKAKIYQFK